MSNILIVDSDGIGLDFSLRCTAAGHVVKHFMRKQHDGQRDKAGDGLVEKVPDWEKWMQWADLIVPTNNTVYIDRLEDFRKLNYPIFGPSKQSARLEVERGYGMQVLKQHGIDVPPYKTFSTLDEAESYCWKHDGKYVFKTLGSEEDKSLTYAAQDCSDMISRIRRWKKFGKKLKGACMLQDFIPGNEIGVSAWMGNDGFLSPRGENFEYKKLLSGDYGPNTGEMGTVMYYAKSKLAKSVLDPLEGFLKSIGHRGDVDINVIVDDKGKAWPLEFTCRLGWPAFFIMCSQHDCDPAQWMLDALNGKDTLKVDSDVYIGIVLAQSPYPNKGGNRDESVGVPIHGVTKDNYDDLHFAEVMMGKGVDCVDGKPVLKDMLVASGEYIMVATGKGESVRQARRRVYKTVDEIHFPNKIVRDDVGEDLEKALPILQAQGYATGVTY